MEEKIRLLFDRSIELSSRHICDIGDDRYKKLDKIFDKLYEEEDILDRPSTVYSFPLEKSCKKIDLRITANRYYLHLLHRSNIPNNIKREVILLKTENSECLNMYKASIMMDIKNQLIIHQWISKSQILQLLIAARENNTNP